MTLLALRHSNKVCRRRETKKIVFIYKPPPSAAAEVSCDLLGVAALWSILYATVTDIPFLKEFSRNNTERRWLASMLW